MCENKEYHFHFENNRRRAVSCKLFSYVSLQLLITGLAIHSFCQLEISSLSIDAATFLEQHSFFGHIINYAITML